MKRSALGVVLVLVLLAMTFINIPGSWAGEYHRYFEFNGGVFLGGELTTLALLMMKVWQDLKAPQIGVDYNVCRTTRALDPEPTLITELKNLGYSSRMVVEKEACHFVGDFEVRADGTLKPKLQSAIRDATRGGADAGADAGAPGSLVA